MPIQDRNRIYDGWVSLEAGVDAGRVGDMLDPNQAESAINMTFRGGNPTTRPGFRKITERFATSLMDQVFVYNDNQKLFKEVSTFVVSPFSDIFTTPENHFLHVGDEIQFSTTGTLPAPLLANTSYYVSNFNLGDTFFHVGTTPGGGGPIVNITTAGTGVQFVGYAIARIIGEYADNSELPFGLDPDGNLIPPENVDGSETIYKNGKFQCAIAYTPHNGDDCIVALIGGRLFKIVPGGIPVKDRSGNIVVPSPLAAQVTEILIEGEPGQKNLRNMKDRPIGYMCQADKWLIAQDGISNAIIYDASKARRAVTATDVDHTEVPCGTIMAYGMGRLVVIVNERDVAFGDLYGSHNLPDPADSLILFTERNFLAEGFDAAIPFQQGVATGAIFFPQLDTSTGNGQLMVFAERGAASFFLSLPREEWKTSQFQILSLLTTGLRGHRSIAVVSEDLWFRSDDGVRSYRQARSEPEGWPHIPQSTNVRQYLENDAEWLLKYASGIYFDNRVIFTTSPMWYQGRPMHWGMVAVDFDILSSFGVAAKPAWEGAWQMSSSIFPIQLLTGTFKGITRAFLFGIDNNNQNQLYELTENDKDDWDGQRINWELVSRKFDFNKLTPQASTPFGENELYGADIWLREVIE